MRTKYTLGVKSAYACYTGGGVYLIYGTATNGDGFFGDLDSSFYHLDRFYEPITDENLGAVLTMGRYNENLIALDPVESRNLLIKALVWISDNKPDGNYNESDLWGLFYKADKHKADTNLI